MNKTATAITALALSGSVYAQTGVTDYRPPITDVNETCCLYLCLFNGKIATSDPTCKDGRREMLKRVAHNFKKPWDFKLPIEAYPKCVSADSDPNAQAIQRSYSQIIMTEDPEHPLGVIIVPHECENEVTGAGLDVKEGNCMATLMTYTLFLYGEQVGTILHVNEKTLATYVQDPITLIAEQVDDSVDLEAAPYVEPLP